MMFPYNPNGQATVEEAFDVRLGYRAYLEHCRQRFSRAEAARESELHRIGVEMVPVFDAGECKTIRDYMDRDISEDGPLFEEELKKQLFLRIFNDEIDSLITGYFGSEYYALWFAFNRNDPADPPGPSFLWHCDGGPNVHLKILIYFSGTEEHGGNTEFLDPVTTARFKQVGYPFSQIQDRLADLEPMAREHAIPYRPFRFRPKAGAAVLFNPMQMLHHGIQPTRGIRYVMQVCLIPAEHGWKTMWGSGMRFNETRNWPPMPGAGV